MKRLLKAIFRAIRRVMRAAARAAAGVGGFVGGIVDGFLSGPYVEEVEDGGFDELVEDTDVAARAEADRIARTPSVREWSPAGLVKRAVELRVGGQPFAKVFDADDPEQKRLLAFVEALDETGLRAITHMPLHTLERHLDVTEFRASGLHPVGKTITMAREAGQQKVAKADEGSKPSRRRRSVSSNVIAEAAATGRQLSIGDLVAATRRALP